MIRLLKKYASTVIFAILLVVLSIPAVHAQSDSYTFLANTWVVVGAGKDFRITNRVYFRVSVPDGGQTLMPSETSRNVASTLSPDGQKAIVGGFTRYEGQVVHLSDYSIQTFHFNTRLLFTPHIWSPDSKYLAVGVYVVCPCDSRPAYLGVIDTDSGDLRVLTDGEFIPANELPVAWSPDESWIAYLDQRYDATIGQHVTTVRLISVDGSQPPRALFAYTSESELYSPVVRWSPDGEYIALTSSQGDMSTIWLLAVQSGAVSFHYAASEYVDPCWSPETDDVVLASETEFTWMTPEGALPLDVSFVDPAVWQLQPGLPNPCAWSPDGTKLSLIYRHDYPTPPGVKIIDFSTRQVADIQIDGEAALLYPYWSPDSRMLALKTYEPGLNPNDIYIYDTTTMEQVMALQSVDFIAWLPEPTQ